MSTLASSLLPWRRGPAAGAPAAPVVPTGVLPIEPTHYQRLGLPEDCTLTELQIAWMRIEPTLPPPLTPVQRRDLPADRTEQRRAEDRRLARAVLRSGAACGLRRLARPRARRPDVLGQAPAAPGLTGLGSAICSPHFARCTLKKQRTLRTLASLVNSRCAIAW